MRDECHGPRSLTLPITGLDCAACARRLEGHLGTLSSVEHVAVDLAAESVTLCAREGRQLDFGEVDSLVGRAGYDLRRSRVRIPVPDLPFGAASEWVEQRVLSVPGVVSASADPSARVAAVDYLVGTTTIDPIPEASGAAGYEAEHAVPVSGGHTGSRTEGARALTSVLAAAAVTIAAVPLADIDSPGVPDFAIALLRRFTEGYLPQLHALNPAALEITILGVSILMVIVLARDWISAGARALGRGVTDQNALRSMAVVLSLATGAVATAITLSGGDRSPYPFVAYATSVWLLALFNVAHWFERRVGREMSETSRTFHGRPWRARSADRMSRWIAAGTAMAATLGFVLWAISGAEHRWIAAITAAVAVLAAGLPSLNSLATTLAMSRAARGIAQRGVQVRQLGMIDRLGRLSRVVLDHRGVVTNGEPFLSSYVLLEGLEQREMLRLAGALAAAAPAFRFDVLRRVDSSTVVVEKQSAAGVSGRVDGVEVDLGNPSWMEERRIALDSLAEELESFIAAGESPLVLAIAGKAKGAIAIGDRFIESTAAAVEALRARGVEVTLLSPEPEGTARAVAAKAGITLVEHDVDPSRRSAVLSRVRRESGEVGLVTGSSGADRSAQVVADLNVSLGDDPTGRADAVISGDLGLLARAVAGARRARESSERISTLWHLIAIPLAAQVLYPLAGKLISPVVIAAGATALIAYLTRRKGSEQ